jgi:hypothetical protein
MLFAGLVNGLAFLILHGMERAGAILSSVGVRRSTFNSWRTIALVVHFTHPIMRAPPKSAAEPKRMPPRIRMARSYHLRGSSRFGQIPLQRRYNDRNRKGTTRIHSPIGDSKKSITGSSVPQVLEHLYGVVPVRHDFINNQLATCCHFDLCCAIHLSVRASRRSRGRVPPSSISSWNLWRSNLGPNSFWARSRSSRILSCPSL